MSLLRLWISVHRVLSCARVSCRFTRTSTDSSRVLLMASAGPALPPAVSDPATAQSDSALAKASEVDYESKRIELVTSLKELANAKALHKRLKNEKKQSFCNSISTLFSQDFLKVS